MLQPTRMQITLSLKTQNAPTFFKRSMLTLERKLPTNGIQTWFWFYILTRDSGLRLGQDQVLLNEKDDPNIIPWSLRFLSGQTKHKTLNKFNDPILGYQYSFINSGLQFTIQRPSLFDASAISINYAHLSSCHHCTMLSTKLPHLSQHLYTWTPGGWRNMRPWRETKRRR